MNILLILALSTMILFFVVSTTKSIIEIKEMLQKLEEKKHMDQLEKAFKIIGPLAVMVGVSENETKETIKFFDEMRSRGVDARDAAHQLRAILKSKVVKA